MVRRSLREPFVWRSSAPHRRFDTCKAIEFGSHDQRTHFVFEPRIVVVDPIMKFTLRYRLPSSPELRADVDTHAPRNVEILLQLLQVGFIHVHSTPIPPRWTQ